MNPALTEPFGLTLIEAAASGLPIVATEDGGPSDILRTCQNGYLISPLDTNAMAQTLLNMLSNTEQWKHFPRTALKTSVAITLGNRMWKSI